MTNSMPHTVASAMVNSPAGEIRIGIVGAGAMGTGIAQVAATAGHQVLLGDSIAGAASRAQAGIRVSLDKLMAKASSTRLHADGFSPESALSTNRWSWTYRPTATARS